MHLSACTAPVQRTNLILRPDDAAGNLRSPPIRSSSRGFDPPA